MRHKTHRVALDSRDLERLLACQVSFLCQYTSNLSRSPSIPSISSARLRNEKWNDENETAKSRQKLLKPVEGERKINGWRGVSVTRSNERSKRTLDARSSWNFDSSVAFSWVSHSTTLNWKKKTNFHSVKPNKWKNCETFFFVNSNIHHRKHRAT